MGYGLRLLIADDDASAEQVEASGARLREELLELDVDAVARLPAGNAPPGTRAVDPTVVGGLMVALPPTLQVLREVLDVVATWVDRSSSRSVHLELDGDVLEIDHVSAGERQALVGAWLHRHGGETGGPA